MKQIYSLFFLFLVTVGFAQAPAGYYTTATGTGYALKTQLYNIIKGHTALSYADLYVTYETSDVDKFFENDGTVLDMYSENPAGVDPYTYAITSAQRCGNYTSEGDCYNRQDCQRALQLRPLSQRLRKAEDSCRCPPFPDHYHRLSVMHRSVQSRTHAVGLASMDAGMFLKRSCTRWINSQQPTRMHNRIRNLIGSCGIC